MFYFHFQSMIVDQTIEKVSFCAPDRNHEKGFAYICRDGTTRRWMCHGFLAVKESVSVSIIYYNYSLSRRTAAEMRLMSWWLSKWPDGCFLEFFYSVVDNRWCLDFFFNRYYVIQLFWHDLFQMYKFGMLNVQNLC